jgi:hypothetical protein
VNKIRLNIFQIGKKHEEVYGIYISDRLEFDKVVDLGFYRYYNKNHFVLISDIHCLLAEPKSKDKRYFCRRCLCSSLSEEKLKEHEKICVEFPPVKIELPHRGTVRFTEYNKMMWNHFCIYSDFECTFKDDIYTPVSFSIFCPLTKDLFYMANSDPCFLMEIFWVKLIDIREKIQKLIDNPKSLEDKKYYDEVSGFCWICGENFLANFNYYIGNKAKDKGYVRIDNRYVKLSQYNMIDENFNPILYGCKECQCDDSSSEDSDDDENDDPWSSAEHDCKCICHSEDIIEKIKNLKKEIKENGFKVRDHDHITGDFRGWAHSKCNLKLDITKQKIPVFFHNGSGFDFHLILYMASGGEIAQSSEVPSPPTFHECYDFVDPLVSLVSVHTHYIFLTFSTTSIIYVLYELL